MKSIVDAPISVKVACLVLIAFVSNFLSPLPMVFGAGIVTFVVFVAAARVAVWIAFNDD